MVQKFINTQYYRLHIITLIFGMILYNPLDIKFMDELCAFLLLILLGYSIIKSQDWSLNKAFLYILGIFAFYFFYSIYIYSNSIKGIITDFIIQMKPYLGFFAVYQLKPDFDKPQKKLLQDICIVCWFLLVPIGIIGIFDPFFIGTVMKHPTYFAAAIVALSITFLLCSQYTMKDKIIFIIMLSIGLASTRSKFYGFFALSVVTVLYFGNINNFKLNLKNIYIIILTLTVIIFLAWNKIELYFLQGLTGEKEKDLIARFVLYSTSIDIFKDYFPFGSGFASFATHASGAYYSDIYSEYGIESVWGLSKNGWEFIADTYYPSLAQFGIAGIIFYCSFWIYILKKAFIFFLKTKNAKYITIALLITGYIAIENIADASITSNRGLFMMMTLGLTLTELKREESNNHL